MFFSLLGAVMSLLSIINTKVVRVSHRLICIADGTERPTVGASTCFHQLDAGTLHWHGSLAAIRSSRAYPFGKRDPIRATNWVVRSSEESSSKPAATELNGDTRLNSVKQRKLLSDGHILVGFCQLLQHLEPGDVPRESWGVSFEANAGQSDLVFAVLIRVNEQFLQNYKTSKVDHISSRHRSSRQVARQNTPQSSQEGLITYMSCFRPTHQNSFFTLAFDDFHANQRGRVLVDAPKLSAEAIVAIGFSITRSTQEISVAEGEFTQFDLYMQPQWRFLV